MSYSAGIVYKKESPERVSLDNHFSPNESQTSPAYGRSWSLLKHLPTGNECKKIALIAACTAALSLCVVGGVIGALSVKQNEGANRTLSYDESMQLNKTDPMCSIFGRILPGCTPLN